MSASGCTQSMLVNRLKPPSSAAFSTQSCAEDGARSKCLKGEFLITTKQPMLVIFDGNSSINYLIQRYATRIGYLLSVKPTATSAESICQLGVEAVIFSSIGNLEDSQLLVAELTNCDVAIIVCASTADQTRTRELGADYCLLHPLVFDSFFEVLKSITSRKIENNDEVIP